MLELTHNDIKKVVIRIQHCQRNFDLNRQVPQEDIDLIIHAATNCPAKQNISFYNLYVITDRSVIESLHKNSVGAVAFNTDRNLTEYVTNSQINANLVLAFQPIEWASMSEHYRTHEYIDEELYRRDQNVAIGIAAGYVNLTASMMGYQTGCCNCFDQDAAMEILGLNTDVDLLMGIGFKSEGKNRRVHSQNDKLIFPTFKKETIKVIYK